MEENAMRRRLVLILAEEKAKGQFIKLAKAHNLPRKVRNDVKKLVEDFLKNLINSVKPYTVISLSQFVQDFYTTIAERFESSSIYKDIPSNGRYKILEVIERYLTERFNKVVFGLIAVQSKDEDASIQRIIDNHYWVTPNHLEAEIKLDLPEVQEQLELAISDLSEMTFKESTLDKLSCITRCSLRINLIFRFCNKRRCTADDYLPILHYVVLKANPPLLRSNINFIHLFGLPQRIQTEEQGYYFISLCGIAEAIEMMNSGSLNISNEEYDRLLSLDVKRVIPLFQLFYSNINNVNKLDFMQTTVTDEPTSFQDKLKELKGSLGNRIWLTFHKTQECDIGLIISIPSLHEMRIMEDDVDGDIEEATEVDESYKPHFSINDVLDEYVIIPDSAVTSVAPYF